ncbi:alpha/beta hydrolase [Patescibacteria group bacterium]|nr:alpha/beta hydrolase [Patescibacteria group bacterium]
MKNILLMILAVFVVAGLYLFFNKRDINLKNPVSNQNQNQKIDINSLNPLSIVRMRNETYPGSDIKIEQTLSPGSNYSRYIISYLSDGLKIYGLLTVPDGTPPKSGWPVIIFNHGYIPPVQYSPTERYIAYVDYFARSGYIVLKSNYRGNGQSEGQPEGAYYSPAYAIDVLNAIGSIKRFKAADPNKIGMWGHSMGGNITMRDLVVDPKDIKVAVIWGGVVGSYDDLINNWQRHVSYRPGPTEMALRNRYRQNLVVQYGQPKSNPSFWNTVDPTYFVKDIIAPVQLDAGGADEEVPVSFSQSFYDKLKAAGKTAELYIYPGSDHNISQGFELAMQRSLGFFDKYLK